LYLNQVQPCLALVPSTTASWMVDFAASTSAMRISHLAVSVFLNQKVPGPEQEM